jgi:hypothetical protein
MPIFFAVSDSPGLSAANKEYNGADAAVTAANDAAASIFRRVMEVPQRIESGKS